MTQTTTDRERIADIRSRFPQWSSAKVLAALGLPGFGEEFAENVLRETVRGGDLFSLALGRS